MSRLLPTLWRTLDHLTFEFEQIKQGYQTRPSGLILSTYNDDNVDGVPENDGKRHESVQCQTPIQEGESRDSPPCSPDSVLNENFVRELHEAIAHPRSSPPRTSAPAPFRSILDIPEIKLEGLSFARNDHGSCYGEVESKMQPEVIMGREAEEYDVAWTGM